MGKESVGSVCTVSAGCWWLCTGGKVAVEDRDRLGEVVLPGKAKGIREKLADTVEQLSGQSLLTSAALTSMSPDYTTLFPYCILLQRNTSMYNILLHTLHLCTKDMSRVHVIFPWLFVDSCFFPRSWTWFSGLRDCISDWFMLVPGRLCCPPPPSIPPV